MSTNTHLKAACYSTASNIFVQVLSRGFTFILGAITLKYLQSSALLGIINVRLALLYTTLQFLSREPFRRACLGEAAKSNSKSWSKIVNTIWLGTLVAIVLAFPLVYIWRMNHPSTDDLAGTSKEDYNVSVLLITASVIVEMLAESCFIYAQAKAITDHNPKVEVLSVTTKSILVAFITVLESSRYKYGQASFILTKITCCQLIASLISVIYSYGRLYKIYSLPAMTFLPTVRPNAIPEGEDIPGILDITCLKLSISFMSQTFLKQLLTEGERFVMTFFNIVSLSDQGIYDVVNNLGSLAARLLFKPIEDSGYTLFSQTVHRHKKLEVQRFHMVQESLMFLVKSMLLIGLIILTFGYNFVPLIVVYGGEKLNNPLAFYLMRWQLFYTPLLAVNGITECFTFAVMDASEIRSYNTQLILLSLIFILAVGLSHPIIGCACFIFSNSLVMLLRITMSYRLIRAYFRKHGRHLTWQDTVPSLTTLISISGVFVFLSACQYYLLDLTQPLSIIFGIILGAYCMVFIIHVSMRHEEDLVDFASKLFKLKFQ